MASEQVILDPVEVASSGRTSIDITEWLDQDGVDWGDAQVEEFLADADRGSAPVDIRFPNRSISGGLTFNRTIGGTTPVVASGLISRKLSLFQREGGTLKRITASGGTVYADVVGATYHATSVSGVDSRQGRDPNASFTLEAIPDFYGDEITLSDHTTTTTNELVFTETGILGDYPGRVRVVVDNDEASADWLGLMYAFRSRNYSSATTAKTFYEAEALQALDTARILALTGASGGTAVTHGTISTNWTPIVGTNIGGTTFLTHTGSYRLRARVYSTSGTAVQTRAIYDIGDFVSPAENDPVRLPGASNFYVVDYGEVRLDPAGQGTHRWQAQIQARGELGTENFSVDEVYLLPLDDGAGVVQATQPGTPTSGLTSYSARDNFTGAVANLNTRTAQLGGSWTTAGAATDFALDGAGLIQRATTADASFRTASLPLSVQDIAASLDFKAVSVAADLRLEVRGTTANVSFGRSGSGQGVFSVTGGSAPIVTVTSGLWYTMVIYAKGALLIGQLYTQGSSNPLVTLIGSAALSSGTVGFSDRNTTGLAATRNYDNFAAWVPSNNDAAIYATRAAQLTTDGAMRQDISGSAYGPVVPQGDNLRIPPSGNEGRTVECFLKPSRGDFASVPDSGLNDDISARISYRPSFLFTP